MSRTETVLYQEINIFAFIIIAVIYLNIRKRMDKHMPEHNLFFIILVLNALILMMDSLMWLLDKQAGFPVRVIYLAATAAYYILNPVICMVWTCYTDYEIYGDFKRLKRMRIFLLIPVVINTVFSVLSLFGNYSFYIDADNAYHRGRLFLILAGSSYSYLIYTLLMILASRQKISRKKYLTLLGFVLPPFIGGILQSLFYGLSLIWVCSTISVLVIYINLQNTQLNTDYLTGLYNRRQLDYYLREKEYGNASRMMMGIMLDLDSFKKINDQYGHFAGDQALEFTADILKKSFGKNDFIARYGGDEFLVVIDVDEHTDITQIIEKVNKNLEQFNSQHIASYQLNLSMGYDVFDCRSDSSVKVFLKHIDSLMYENKKSMKHIVS